MMGLILMQSTTFAVKRHYEDIPIVIGGDAYFPPFEYIDTNDVYKGFNIDIMHAIAIEMGLDIEIKPMMWKDVTHALQKGDIDVIQGIKYTEERSKIFTFSEPYLESSQSIFIAKDNDYIKSLDDLENKTIAIQENDVAGDIVASIKGVTVLEAKSQLEALQFLIDGRSDVYIGNRQTGLYSIQKYGYSSDVKVIGSPINPQKYGLAVKKGNEEVLYIFDEGLKIIKKNGTYDKIHDKWFGEEIYSTYEVLKNYLYMFGSVLFVLGIIVFFNVRLNRVLKIEVSKQVKEIEQSNLFKEHIINSIFSGLMTFDTKGTVLSVNKNVSEICKIDANAFVGENLEHTEFNDFIDMSLFKKALITGERFINCESQVTIENKERVIEYNIYPIKDTQDVLKGITVTFLDITLRKQNALQIQRKDKLESLGRLTANIAHEIRNPLTAIKTYIELIPKKMNNPEFQQQIVKDVPMVIERLNGLISELLEYAKPRVANKEVILLEKPILEVMSLIDGELHKHNIKVQSDFDAKYHVKIDVQQFKQILINLLINSIEAVKDSVYPAIAVRTYKRNNNIIIEVIDNGIGISREEIEFVFEPFYTKKANGTGLGLSIAQQLAHENEGQLTANSDQGIGTTMRLHLPYMQSASSQNTQDHRGQAT